MSALRVSRSFSKITTILNDKHSKFNHYPYIYSALAGTITFGSTLAISTYAQQNLFHVSTGSIPPLPSLLGIGSVAIASLASHCAASSFLMLSVNDKRNQVQQYGTNERGYLDSSSDTTSTKIGMTNFPVLWNGKASAQVWEKVTLLLCIVQGPHNRIQVFGEQKNRVNFVSKTFALFVAISHSGSPLVYWPSS